MDTPDPTPEHPEPWNIPPPQEAGKISLIARLMTRARNWPVWVARASEPREKQLLDILKETCREMGLKKPPRLLIYDDDRPNASSLIVTGEVMFSTNLLDIMTPRQVKAVMAHELTHHIYRGRDAVILGTNIALTEIGTLAALNAAYRWKPQNRIGQFVRLATLMEFAGDIAALMGFGVVQSWFRRRAEKGADVGAARVTGAEPMIEALEKLEQRATEIRGEEEQESRFNWKKYTVDLPLFRSYPSTKERIRNILEHAPPGSFTEKIETQDRSQSLSEQR